MKNDFAPVVGHRFNLRGDWGGVLDCEVLAIEPNRTLPTPGILRTTMRPVNLQSVVTFTLTHTRNGNSPAHGAVGLPPRSEAGRRRRPCRVAAVLRTAGSGLGADRLKSAAKQALDSLRLVLRGGPIELEYVDSAVPPLAVPSPLR